MADIFEQVSGTAKVSGLARRLTPMTAGGVAEVISLPRVKAVQVAANVAFDASDYGDVEFQFSSGTVSVTRSLDGVQGFVPWPVTDSKGASGASAGAAGIWSTDGAGFLKFSAAVTVRGGN